MRSDMAKVIVERPRFCSRLRNRKSGMRLRAGDMDVELQSVPIKRRDKELNENLAPLRRYLERQIGRPWDKIYSEIRSNLDARKATGLHILQHVGDYVDLHCVLDGKSDVYACRSGVLAPVRGMYVHPKTGLLRKAAARVRTTTSRTG